MRRRCALVLGALATLGPAAAAGAQERGVHIDPGSPAGKEYAIPIERARREAAGGGGIRDVKTSTPAVVPIFGRGVTPAKPKSKPRKNKRSASSAPRATPAQPEALSSAAAVQAALRSPSTAGWTGGLVAAVVLAGALVALVLRRRRA